MDLNIHPPISGPMLFTSIIRAKGTDQERVVSLETIFIPDVEVITLFIGSRALGVSVRNLFEDLNELIAANKEESELPTEFFVPSLWNEIEKLPGEERAILLDFWALAHDLAKGMGYKETWNVPTSNSKIDGSTYVLQKPS